MPAHDPYDVVRQFEDALCEYTGAKYAVATTSCTMALLLSMAWWRQQMPGLQTVILPRRTYVGAVQSAWNAGFEVEFRDLDWSGEYTVYSTTIVDSARRFTSGMYKRDDLRCVSFHWTKHLAIGQGGAVLHDDPNLDDWLRRARFDGRKEGVDPQRDRFMYPAWHAIMMPRDAAEGLTRLATLPRHNDDLPNSDYPDLKDAFE